MENESPLNLFLGTLLFMLLILVGCTIFSTVKKLHRQRRQPAQIAPHASPTSLHAAHVTEADAEAQRAWFATDAATETADATSDSRIATARQRAMLLQEQMRMAELQLMDEDRAIAHALEASLGNRQGETAQRPQQECAMQQALEVREHTHAQAPHTHVCKRMIVTNSCACARPLWSRPPS